MNSKKIKNAIGFNANYTIENALKKFKKIFESKKIKNPNLKKFSNYDSLK